MGKVPEKGVIPKQLTDATARFVERNDKGLGLNWVESKAFSVRLPPELESRVLALKERKINRSEWIRAAIAEKFEREAETN